MLGIGIRVILVRAWVQILSWKFGRTDTLTVLGWVVKWTRSNWGPYLAKDSCTLLWWRLRTATLKRAFSGFTTNPERLGADNNLFELWLRWYADAIPCTWASPHCSSPNVNDEHPEYHCHKSSPPAALDFSSFTATNTDVLSQDPWKVHVLVVITARPLLHPRSLVGVPHFRPHFLNSEILKAVF